LSSAQALAFGKTKPRLGRQAGVLRQSSKLSHWINALPELTWQAQTGSDMRFHKLPQSIRQCRKVRSFSAGMPPAPNSLI
jgi:hypothetical protein